MKVAQSAPKLHGCGSMQTACAGELWLTAQSTSSHWPLLPQTQWDSHQLLLQTCVSDTTPSSARLCDFLNKLFVIGLQSGRHDVVKKNKMWCFSVDGSITISNDITYIRIKQEGIPQHHGMLLKKKQILHGLKVLKMWRRVEFKMLGISILKKFFCFGNYIIYEGRFKYLILLNTLGLYFFLPNMRNFKGILFSTQSRDQNQKTFLDTAVSLLMYVSLLENRIDCEGNWIMPTYSVVTCAFDNYTENLNNPVLATVPQIHTTSISHWKIKLS